MQEQSQAILKIKKEFGLRTFADPEQVRSILTDFLPGEYNSKSRRRIMNAVESDALRTFLKLMRSGNTPQDSFNAASAALMDATDMSKEVSDEVMMWFAEALGVSDRIQITPPSGGYGSSQSSSQNTYGNTANSGNRYGSSQNTGNSNRYGSSQNSGQNTYGNTANSSEIYLCGEKYDINAMSLTLDGKRLSSSDLDKIKQFKNLRALSMKNAGIGDLSFLSSCTGLMDINLRDNRITDFSPLNKMSYLKMLDLSSNEISRLPDMDSMGSLQHLNLENNKIKDLSPISNITNLIVLRLANNLIERVDPLYACRSLQKLSIGNNYVSGQDVDMLSRALPNCSIDVSLNKNNSNAGSHGNNSAARNNGSPQTNYDASAFGSNSGTPYNSTPQPAANQYNNFSNDATKQFTEESFRKMKIVNRVVAIVILVISVISLVFYYFGYSTALDQSARTAERFRSTNQAIANTGSIAFYVSIYLLCLNASYQFPLINDKRVYKFYQKKAIICIAMQAPLYLMCLFSPTGEYTLFHTITDILLIPWFISLFIAAKNTNAERCRHITASL